MKADRIVIQKLKLDVYSDATAAPASLLDAVMEDLKTELLPLLERGLHGLAPKAGHLVVDHLDLEVEVEAAADWKIAVSAAVEDKLQQAIVRAEAEPGNSDMRSETGMRQLSEEVRIVRAWVTFLREGILPWWKESLGVKRLPDLIHLTAEHPAPAIWAHPELLGALAFEPVAAQRLVQQMPVADLRKMLGSVLGERSYLAEFFVAAESSRVVWRQVAPALVRAMPALVRAESAGDPDPIWYAQVLACFQDLDEVAVWEALAFLPEAVQKAWQVNLARVREELTARLAVPGPEGSAPDGLGVALPEQLVAGPQQVSDHPADGMTRGSLPSSAAKADDPFLKTVDQDELVTENYFPYTGLVLLHPFLPSLFGNLGLVDEDAAWITPHNQVEAIYALYFLATGEWEASEDALFLPKVLTGFPLDQALPALDEIPFAEQLEAERAEILALVQANWRPMRTCTWENLAVDFLQRPGKLSRTRAGHWKLQVESRTVDVLLRFLGWGLSPIRYGWMEEFLMVEWK